MAINGKYFAKNITTSGADNDLVTVMETAMGNTNMQIEKFTLISSSLFTVSVNNVGFSDVYQDADGLYKLSLDAQDVLATSIKVHENGIDVFFAIVFTNNESPF